MKILGLDPGSEKSAICGLWTGEKEEVRDFQKVENGQLLHLLDPLSGVYDVLVIEDTKAFTFTGGKDGRFFPEQVRRTAFMAGRFAERWGDRWTLLDRREVKNHLCGRNNANDRMVRDALIDRFGGSREVAIGRKADRGPLYGVKADCWAALAVACVWSDQ